MFKSKAKKRPEPVIVKGLGKGKTASEEELEMKRNRSRRRDKSCVLCIGSVGAGKTTMIEMCLGKDGLASSPESSLEATQFKVYSKDEDSSTVWVDTPGACWEEKHWEDALEMQERLLDFLDNQGVGSVSAVLWCIQPSQGGGRGSDPRQERQAEFVSMLWPKRAWGRTVVACKASARPERDAEAAIRMAEDYSSFRRPRVVGFRLLHSFGNEEREALERDKSARAAVGAATAVEASEAVLEAIRGCEEEEESMVLFGAKGSRGANGEDDGLEDLFLDRKEEEDCREEVKCLFGLPPTVFAKPF